MDGIGVMCVGVLLRGVVSASCVWGAWNRSRKLHQSEELDIRTMLYRAAVLALTAQASAALLHTPTALARSGVATVSVPRHSFVQLAAEPAVEANVATEDDCGCEDASPTAQGVMMNGVSVTGSTLRSMVLADATGKPTSASSLIGEDGKAVVVFLRHLG